MARTSAPTLLLSLVLGLAVFTVAGLVASGALPVPAASTPSSGPRILVLGTAQDGGLPHAACGCERCLRARRDPAFRRRVASLAIHLPASDRVVLIDAGPDIREQLAAVAALRRAPRPTGKVDRAPVDGVFLTHAHIGHYLGLAFFGFEAVSTEGLSVYASPRMAAFLRANGPWSQLVRLGNIAITEIRPGVPVTLGEGVSVTGFPVPHRDEYSDTQAFVLRGPRASVLYVPDTDAWSTWSRPLPEVLKAEKIDTALLDGTFYSPEEVPGRDVTKIGHPLMTETMDLLKPLVRDGKLRVLFTHLNHSNPALDPASAARKSIEARGFRVLDDGERLDL